MLPVRRGGLSFGRRTFALLELDKRSVKELRSCSRSGFLSLALALPVLLPGAAALAQSPPSSQGTDNTRAARRPTHGYRGATLDDRVRTLARNLDLSEAQQSAVKKILEERQEETLRLRLDASLTGSARIDKFRALQEKTVERIRGVLNEEQKKKYDPLVVRKLPPAAEHRSVEDWLKATTPR